MSILFNNFLVSNPLTDAICFVPGPWTPVCVAKDVGGTIADSIAISDDVITQAKTLIANQGKEVACSMVGDVITEAMKQPEITKRIDKEVRIGRNKIIKKLPFLLGMLILVILTVMFFYWKWTILGLIGVGSIAIVAFLLTIGMKILVKDAISAAANTMIMDTICKDTD